jgi:transcriptional regulator with XRE-family HTH domain
MPPRERPVDRGKRDAQRHLRDIGSELREARLGAGLSQHAVGNAVGISHSAVSRIEAAAAPTVALARLDQMAAVLGLRLSVRAYPVGRPVRDDAQLALLGRLRSMLHPTLRWRTETPIPIDGDLRAWDASIAGPGWTVYVDAETRIRDTQALERRTLLKQRDTGTDRVLLVVADTRSNRAILRSLPSSLIGATINGSTALAALQSGRDPGGCAVVML